LKSADRTELYFLFELVERRHDETSTVFCAQYKLENWYSRLGGGILADSIMDRIIHKAVNVYAGNINMRKLLFSWVPPKRRYPM
jgi:DNA replication protein DnaC